MASYKAKPQIDPLVRQQIETEKRSARAEERKQVLLNAKQRMYGIDVEALNAQKAAKEEMARMEAQRNLYYDDLNLYHANVIKDMEKNKQVNNRTRMMALNDERLEHINARDNEREEAKQKFESFKERTSNFLNFQGEDVDRDARTKAMHIQQQDWLSQQISELSAKEAFDKKEAEEYDARQAALNDMMKEDEQEMMDEFKQRRYQVAAENKALAYAKIAREEEEAQLNRSLNEMELRNQVNSAYLNEEYTGSGDGRVGFKGFSQQQLQSILDEQEYQRQAKVVSDAASKAEDLAYDQQQTDIRRMMILQDREKMRNKTKSLLQLREERKTQALAKTEKYNYLDTVMFSDPIREEYFEQFGTSGR